MDQWLTAAGTAEGANSSPNHLAWTDPVAALAAVGSLIVVVLAAFYARDQLREIRRTRYAEAMFILSHRWDALTDSRQALTAYREREHELVAALTRAIALNTREYFVLVRVPNFFEDLAIQVEARSIPFDMVSDSFGDAIDRYWTIWKHAVHLLREEAAPTHVNFERLAKKVKDHTTQHSSRRGRMKRESASAE